MTASFKNRLLKILIGSGLVFIALFAFRFVYGYTTGAREVQEEYFSDFFSSIENQKRNYASNKYRYLKSEGGNGGGGGALPTVKPQEFDVNQKFEKTATVKSKTTKYEEDETTLREKIKTENAIIQYEQNSGGKGNRELHLMIGIPPNKFEMFYDGILKIGTVGSKEITKIDKTNEFKTLNAKKASLEITRKSLLEIKKQSGRIDEFINLQNRILEIEQELQNLGVMLGDFDEENEFCTVRFSLIEKKIVAISMLHRLKVAFEWTVQYYLLTMCILAASTFFGFFLLLIIDKLLPSIIGRMNQ